MENQQPESPPQRSPSPERAKSPAVEEAQASPIAHCSQYRTEEYELQNGAHPAGDPRHEKVGGWLQAAYASDGPYPTPLAAPRKDQYVSDSDSDYGRPHRRRRRSPLVTRIKHGVLHVHKDCEGRIPLC